MGVTSFVKRLVVSPFTGIYYTIEAMFLPRHLGQLPYGVPVRPHIPTSDGTCQAVHPDILRSAQTGQPFLLAFTPYPFADNRYENPCILISEDGLRFREEQRGLNPLTSAPAVDHNNDPDLILIEGCYYIIYLETLRPECQNLVLLRSEDRISWSRSSLATYNLQGPNPGPFILSPALAVRDGILFLFYVNKSANPYRIEFLTSDRIDEWSSREVQEPTFDQLPLVPWHIDVVEANGMYYMLITALSSPSGGRHGFDLYIAKSDDLERWQFSLRKVFPSKPFGCKDVYRSTAFCDGPDIYIYFSYESRLGEWKIGLVRRRISDFFPPEG